MGERQAGQLQPVFCHTDEVVIRDDVLNCEVSPLYLHVQYR